MKHQFEIWSEGYSVTGNYSGAHFHGTVEAENFDEAVMRKFEKNETFHYDTVNHKHTLWGCRIFDNETDARRSFG